MAREFDAQAMETAALEAARELINYALQGNTETIAVAAVADWWNRHYLKAGHKRLGRIMVKIAKGGLPNGNE